MKVAIVSRGLPQRVLGGAEAYALDLALGLSARHEIVVISGEASRPQEPNVEFVGVPALRPFRSDWTSSRKAIWHGMDLWQQSSFQGVKDALRRHRPDVVHSHNVQGLSSSVFAAIGSSDVPHVNTAHDFNLICMRASLTRDGERCSGRCLGCIPQRLSRSYLVRRHLSLLIAPSEFVRHVHVAAGVEGTMGSRTIPQGARGPSPRLRRPKEGSVRLGYIGKLAPNKGVMTLLRALDLLLDGFMLTVAGTGELEREIEDRARDDPRCEFLGAVAGEEKRQFFDQIDVLVIPSEWEENAPLVAIEAAVAGIPCVVSARGGLPETPECVTFRSGSAEDLARTLVEEWRTVEERSRRLIDRHQEFEFDTHLERVEQALLGVVDRA